jgi:MFS family permease
VKAELNAPEAVLTCKKKSLLGPDAVSSTLPQCIPMTLAQLGLVSSIFTLGGLIGALVAAPISGTRGRLYTMKLTAIFFVLGPLFEALAPSITVISIGRFLSGIGAGASIVVVPIYVSEIAPPAERGFFGSFTQVMINGGIFTAQLLGYFYSYDQMWRLVLGAGGAIGIVLGVGLFGAAESPKWLASTGKVKLGSEILQRIRGHEYDIDEEVQSWALGADPNPGLSVLRVDAISNDHRRGTRLAEQRRSGTGRPG